MNTQQIRDEIMAIDVPEPEIKEFLTLDVSDDDRYIAFVALHNGRVVNLCESLESATTWADYMMMRGNVGEWVIIEAALTISELYDTFNLFHVHALEETVYYVLDVERPLP